MNTPLTRAHAEQLDRSDALAPFRDEFHLPQRHDGSPSVYLCGHSLGLASRRALRIVNEELEHWARLGVDGHFDSPRPWLSYHELLTNGLAHLTGAAPIEVVAMNSLTVNLHLMLATFYRPTPERYKILIEQQAFSSDRYAVASQIVRHGLDPAAALLAIAPDEDGALSTGRLCDVIEREGARIAVVLLPGVQYLTGQWLDMRTLAECARKQGCIVGFDLAHAVGNVPLQLHDWNADFAVWCGYKYLNGGPGATAGCFVHERHARNFDLPRFAGWWGHDKSSRFDMPAQFRPLPGAEGWQISNPPILSTAPLVASMELFERAGMQTLRAKSVLLTGYLESLLRQQLSDSVTIITPSDRDARGCQLSLRLRRSAEDARAVHKSLGARGFVCDWREPDVIRAAPVPLYNTFTEVWEFVEALKQALASAG
jgi:kynureninase